MAAFGAGSNLFGSKPATTTATTTAATGFAGLKLPTASTAAATGIQSQCFLLHTL